MWEALTHYGKDRYLGENEKELKNEERFFTKYGPDSIFNDQRNWNKKKRHTYEGINEIQS